MSDDIVTRLRLYAKRMDETRSTVLGLLLADAADEIERLRQPLGNAERLPRKDTNGEQPRQG
jgi:hypothetical protein